MPQEDPELKAQLHQAREENISLEKALLQDRAKIKDLEKKLSTNEGKIARTSLITRIQNKILLFSGKCFIGRPVNKSIEEFRDQIQKTYNETKSGKFSDAARRMVDEHPKTTLNLIAAVSARLLRRSWFVYVASGATLIAAFTGFWLASEANHLLSNQNEKIDDQGSLVSYQNSLLESQNKKIEIQSHLSEASRRSNLIFELTSIYEKIDEEQDEFRKRFFARKTQFGEPEEFTISKLTAGRIVALSRSLKPYRYLDDSGNLIETSLSPERAQLLLSLTNLQIPLPHGASWEHADLAGAELSNTLLESQNLRNVDFSNANLSNSKLSKSNLANADLGGAKLSRAKLEGCNLSGANLRMADLTNSSISLSSLRDSDLSGAKLSDCVLKQSNCSNANFSGANLAGADLTFANLSDIDFSGAIFTETRADGPKMHLFDVPEWSKQSLDHLFSFDNRKVPGRHGLHGPHTIETGYIGAFENRGKLVSAKLNGAHFSGSTLRDVRFYRMDLKRTDFSGTDLKEVEFIESDLSGADFSWSDLSGQDLSGQDLSGAVFTGANLTRANLANTKLNKTVFVLANLSHVDLNQADLGRSTIRWRNSNIFGIKNAPKFFIEKAPNREIMRIEDIDKWEEYVKEQKPNILQLLNFEQLIAE